MTSREGSRGLKARLTIAKESMRTELKTKGNRSFTSRVISIHWRRPLRIRVRKGFKYTTTSKVSRDRSKRDALISLTPVEIWRVSTCTMSSSREISNSSTTRQLMLMMSRRGNSRLTSRSRMNWDQTIRRLRIRSWDSKCLRRRNVMLRRGSEVFLIKLIIEPTT